MKYCFVIPSGQLHRIKELDHLPDVGFEIRLDTFLTVPDIRGIRAITKRPLLATFRTRHHLGRGNRADRNTHGWLWRVRCLATGFEMVDLEMDEVDLSQKIAAIHGGGGKVVLSHHESCPGMVLTDKLKKALEMGADVVKLIGQGGSTSDFKTQRDLYQIVGDTPFIHFFMGAEFAASRILSLIYGAPFTYAVDDHQGAVVPGLLPWSTLSKVFRPHQITANKLRLFAVLGSPIAHSRSPRYHNPLLKHLAKDALFLALPAADEADFAILRDTFPEWCGAAVTKPMKGVAFHAASAFVHGDIADLGAANTLLFKGEGCTAANTDYLAMKRLLSREETVGPIRVIGYGGLGKAVVRAGISLRKQVEVTNRSADKLADLSDEVCVIPWEERHREGAGTLVQCTSVGMSPRSGESPLDSLPDSCRLLIETIYHPRETRLMKLANTARVETWDGMTLFDLQAKIQNELFCELLG